MTRTDSRLLGSVPKCAVRWWSVPRFTTQVAHRLRRPCCTAVSQHRNPINIPVPPSSPSTSTSSLVLLVGITRLAAPSPPRPPPLLQGVSGFLAHTPLPTPLEFTFSAPFPRLNLTRYNPSRKLSSPCWFKNHESVTGGAAINLHDQVCSQPVTTRRRGARLQPALNPYSLSAPRQEWPPS